MISPKTALVSPPLQASSAFPEDFKGEPDPSHQSFLTTFALHFEAVLFFVVLDLKALIFLMLPFKVSFFFTLLHGGFSHGILSLLFLYLFRGCHSSKSVIIAWLRREPNLTETFVLSATLLRSAKTCLTFTRLLAFTRNEGLTAALIN